MIHGGYFVDMDVGREVRKTEQKKMEKWKVEGEKGKIDGGLGDSFFCEKRELFPKIYQFLLGKKRTILIAYCWEGCFCANCCKNSQSRPAAPTRTIFISATLETWNPERSLINAA